MFTTRKAVVLHYDSTYRLCAQAFVKLVNGDSSLTPFVCA
jgi:hypothetical protein